MAALGDSDTPVKYYTPDEANRALPLVSRIVADIVRQIGLIEDLQQRLSGTTSGSGSGPGRSGGKERDVYAEEVAFTKEELRAERDRLREYVQELDKLGVQLKGPDGLCDFPCLHEGRTVLLCWRPGEARVGHWHEVDAGFAGRRPITPDFPARELSDAGRDADAEPNPPRVKV